MTPRYHVGGQILHALLAGHQGDNRVGNGWVYATCDDPDALYARAEAAGAEVTMELTDREYGSRDFAVRDLEGNQWNFGTYEPT